MKKYMKSDKEYDVRFAVVVLMNYYIDDVYSDFAVDYFINIKSDFYYVNMAAAWALSVAFVKYSDKVMPAIEDGRLTDEIHNMTISKIRDSFRVDKETKAYLKGLRK